MISLRTVKKFCKDYTRIENYEEAMNDTTQTWICHHILGEILSKEQLIDHNFYYDVPPCMLKFVTKREHKQIHQNGKHRSEETCRKMSEALKGRTFSEETRIKMSEAKKGKTNSAEHCRNISESMKGIVRSEDTRKKMSEAKKGLLKNKTWKIINGKRVWLSKEG